MYITSRLILGIVFGFEIITVEPQNEDEKAYQVYKLDLGFVSINMINA